MFERQKRIECEWNDSPSFLFLGFVPCFGLVALFLPGLNGHYCNKKHPIITEVEQIHDIDCGTRVKF